MRSEELAEHMATVVGRCRGRVLGTGNDQYSQGNKQAFETMPLTQLFDETFEELEDVIVYATMLHYRISMLKLAHTKSLINYDTWKDADCL